MKLTALVRSLVLGAALSAGGLFANTVTLTSTGFNGGLNGGEFKAVTSQDGTFITFCIEKTVTVSLGSSYSYTISPVAQSGGLDTHSAGPGDPISAGTAWLYEQLRAGTLISAAGPGLYAAAHNFNAGQLQKAFWDLEDEAADVGNFYVALAVSHFASLSQNAYADAGPGSRVQAMNIWTSSHGDVQSQLILVPDSGITVALLGLGLLSLAALRRKL